MGIALQYMYVHPDKKSKSVTEVGIYRKKDFKKKENKLLFKKKK